MVQGVAISILCGVTDVHLWFLIFMSQAVGLALGFIIEVLPADPEVSQNGAAAAAEEEEGPKMLPVATNAVRRSSAILVIFDFFFYSLFTISSRTIRAWFLSRLFERFCGAFQPFQYSLLGW